MQRLRKAQKGAKTQDTAYIGIRLSCGSQTAS
jgi:hypothetical protein